MKSSSLVGFIAAPLMLLALALPALSADTAQPATCKDGTTSAVSGRGACSGHGGVQMAAKTTAPESVPAAMPAPAAASGAASTCKDGTTSTTTGRGACSGHGGVQKATKEKSAAAAAAAPAASAAPVAAAPATAAAPAAAAAAAKTPAAAKTSVASKSAPTEAASSLDPTGATAKCKDGTYSKSQHHSGTCSNHGGVAEWMTAAK